MNYYELFIPIIFLWYWFHNSALSKYIIKINQLLNYKIRYKKYKVSFLMKTSSKKQTKSLNLSKINK